MVCSVFQVAAVHQRTAQQEAGGGEGKRLLARVHVADVRCQRQAGPGADRLLTDCFTSVGGGVFPSLLPNLISASVTVSSRPSDMPVATVTTVLSSSPLVFLCERAS